MDTFSETKKAPKKGKLKIYFGAAPGVGKTHSLLQDAGVQHKQQVDVVIGVINSHGRPELENLMQGLDVLPPRIVDLMGQTFTEFNLEEALRRHPQLILIDEMEHTNVLGSRHTKRWQDIKELLDRGIDVWTTLNVQNIESLNDVISQITRITIKETVPDSMLEKANIIELVDLSPDDLLKRLQEGKVNIAAPIDPAKQYLFRKGNLTALRELALRVTAERVDAQIMDYRHDLGIRHIWPARERLLVCVGPSNKSAKMIRAARRMATRLESEWIAVNVQTPRLELSEAARTKTLENLRLAEQLGAEIQTIVGKDIVKEIINFARERNVTRIIIGKGIHSRWRELFFGNLVEDLVRHSGEIDVYIIHHPSAKKTLVKKPRSTLAFPVYYLIAFLMPILATVINFILPNQFEPSNLMMIYFFMVIMVSLFGKLGPAVFSACFSTLLYYIVFIRVLPSFENSFQFITLFLMLLTNLLIAQFIVLGKKVQPIDLTKSYSSTLHTLTRQLASTRGIDKLLAIAARFLSEIFDSEVIIMLHENNQLTIKARYQSVQLLNAKEESIAQWSYELGQMAGFGTNNLSSSDSIYVPLLGTQGALGVIRLRPRTTEKILTPERIFFLEACANQIALAVEVDHLHEQTRRSEFKIETDEARKALIQAVSHDLRTPIVSIMGAASSLIEMGKIPDVTLLPTLANDIYREADQLNRLINNLLQITYLESESIKLQKEPSSLKAVIENVEKTLHRELSNRKLEVSIPPNLPFIPFDKVLLEQVFENLIDNAVKFSPPHSTIRISAEKEQNRVIVSVDDEGPGITPDEVDRLFEKFYRGRMLGSEHGLGLGLALCDMIIKAHGGLLWAENRSSGGASFKFTLPL